MLTIANLHSALPPGLAEHAPSPVVFVSRCPGCEGGPLVRLPTPGRWIGTEVFAPLAGRIGLCRCQRCTLVFVNPRPSTLLLDRFYSGDTYACHGDNNSASTRIKAEVVLDKIEAHAPRARRLLDFGAGGGWLLEEARRRGFDALGYDIGARGLECCRRLGLPVTDRLDHLQAGSFDAILLHHVFEHLADPDGTLSELARLLAPGGKLFIEVPNARSLRARLSPPLSRHIGFDERYRAFPIHLFYFGPASLKLLLERRGWETVGLETYGLGLDELILRRLAPGQAYGVAPGARVAALGRAAGSWRRHIKRVLFQSMLGECLLAVASWAGRDQS